MREIRKMKITLLCVCVCVCSFEMHNVSDADAFAIAEDGVMDVCACSCGVGGVAIRRGFVNNFIYTTYLMAGVLRNIYRRPEVQRVH